MWQKKEEERQTCDKKRRTKTNMWQKKKNKDKHVPRKQ